MDIQATIHESDLYILSPRATELSVTVNGSRENLRNLENEFKL